MPTVSDLGLRRAFALALGLPFKAPPREFDAEELASIDHLSWSDTGEAEAYPGRWACVERLDGAEACVGVRELAMTGNSIRDLSPLAACVALETLYLGGNAIADLSPVTGLPKLRQLSVYDNPVASVAPLRAAAALQQLDLGGGRVTDFSPLLELPQLGELRLGRYRVELSEAQAEVLAELRARGVNVVAYGALDDQIKAALAKRTFAAAGEVSPELGAAVEALKAVGMDAAAAGLLESGPGARDEHGYTALHLVATARPSTLGCSAAELAALVGPLVAAGVDPHAQCYESLDTALSHNLSKRGEGEVFEALLAVTQDLERPPHRTALTHALYALLKGWPDAEARVQALRERGADICAAAPVVMAARAGRVDLVRAALEAGADPQAAAYYYSAYSLLEVATWRDDLDLMRALLDRGASPTDRHPIAEVRSAEALHLLLERGATLPELSLHRWQHPLHRLVGLSVFQKSDEALEEAMGVADAVVALGQSVDVRTWDGHAPVGKIVDSGAGYSADSKRRTKAFMDHLFLRGAAPRLRSASGQSALDFTRRSEARDYARAHKVGKGATMAKQDAKKLAKAKIWAPDKPAWALLRSVAARDEWALTGAEAQTKARLIALVEAVEHPLTADVLASGDLGLAVSWLHDRGASRDPVGRTGLHRAVRVDDPGLRRRLVLGLLDAGADPARTNWSGHSPLAEWLYWVAPKEYDAELFEALARPDALSGAVDRLALASRWPEGLQAELAEALIARGAPVTAPADFEALVRVGAPGPLAMAVERGASVNPGLPGAMSSTPLAVAIEAGKLEAAAWLIQAGADPNGNGYAVPLHKARRPEAVRLLLEGGAAPGQRRVGFGCDTALHMLASSARYNMDDAGFDCIALLLDAGVDPRAPNAKGDTALGLLKRSDNERAKALVAQIEAA